MSGFNPPTVAIPEMNRSNPRFENKWLIILIFAVALVWAVYTAALGWHNGLSIHNFRQTQTAITSYYMIRGGPFLKYETPVFGVPWSIPFEFPLYQWPQEPLAARHLFLLHKHVEND